MPVAVEARSLIPNNLLAGKVALVTGGATGIGEAIAKLFAIAGAKVVVNGLPGDPVKEVVAEIVELGQSAAPCIADVGTLEGSNALMNVALQSFGRIDTLVCNAGLFPENVEVSEFPVERFEELLHTNIRGVFLPVRAALPHLKKSQGSIIGLGSEAGLLGAGSIVSYGATKGWVHAFLRGVAAEQAKYGVRANVVAPGPIDTEMTRPTKGEISVKNALMGTQATALGRRGTPEEVANVCVFLASDLATFVTGAIYSVDGGSTASQGMPGLEAKGTARKAPAPTVRLQHQHAGRGVLHD